MIQLKEQKLWINSLGSYLVLPTNTHENLEKIAELMGLSESPGKFSYTGIRDQLKVKLDDFSLYGTDLVIQEGKPIPLLDTTHVANHHQLIAHLPYAKTEGMTLVAEKEDLKASTIRLPEIFIKNWKIFGEKRIDLYGFAHNRRYQNSGKDLRLYGISLHISIPELVEQQ